MKSRRLPDFTGQRFARLLVNGRASAHGARHVFYSCSCDCGNPATVQSTHLASGATQSCGCLNSELAAARKLTHGDSRKKRIAPEYRAWQHMIGRCYDEKDARYARYGGRGIRVCERWRTSYKAFLNDLGRRTTPLHSLDRYPNNDGNYEPGNVRWATDEEQARNSSKAHLVAVGDEARSLSGWAEEDQAPSAGLASTRLQRGWDPVKAVTTPPLMDWDRRKGRRHG